MTLDELEQACASADESALKYGRTESGFNVVLPRRAGNGLRMRVAPGLLGELLSENSQGHSVVRVKTVDVRRWLVKARATQ